MLVPINEFAKQCGVSVSTIRRWESLGRLSSERTKGGHRRYCTNQISNIKNIQKIVIGYARVSTSNKKDDLERQAKVLELYCAAKGLNYRIISDIGSGLNYTKKGLIELIDLIESESISAIVITHKDRLLRFGSEIIYRLCKIHNIEIHIINADDKPDYQNELVKDVLSILTVFSARLYGSRSNKNKKIVEENEKLFSEEEVSEEQ